MKINAKIECYLSERAALAVSELVALGLDEDLALGVLERIWPETAIYSLEEEEVHNAGVNS